MIKIEGAAGGDTNCREESVGTAVISCRDPSPILELRKEVLNFVTRFIECPVVGYEDLSVPSWRDARRHATAP